MYVMTTYAQLIREMDAFDELHNAWTELDSHDVPWQFCRTCREVWPCEAAKRSVQFMDFDA